MPSLYYQTLGHGPKALLAFHGIGQSGLSCYEQLGKSWSQHYTIYAFDLPFHGKSINQFPEDEQVSKKIVQDILQDFLDINQIIRFSVAGFSMGGKFALVTLEAFAPSIDSLYLFAPDGISVHPLYAFATKFAFTRFIFRTIIFKKDWLFAFAKLLVWLKLQPEVNLRFAQAMLQTTQQQNQVYNTLVNFRSLRVNIKYLLGLINKYRISVVLFVGNYDKILVKKSVFPLSQHLPASALIELNCGHTRLIETVARDFRVGT